MAILYITEYGNMAEDQKGRTIPVGLEPASQSQIVPYTAAASSKVLKKNTRFVRLIADADAYVEFGASPTATAGSTKMQADVAEYFGVSGVKEMKISAYDGSS